MSKTETTIGVEKYDIIEGTIYRVQDKDGRGPYTPGNVAIAVRIVYPKWYQFWKRPYKVIDWYEVKL